MHNTCTDRAGTETKHTDTNYIISTRDRSHSKIGSTYIGTIDKIVLDR